MDNHEQQADRDGDGGRERRSLRELLRIAGFVLMAVAVIKELRTPADQRTWHGELLGFVPYDLRRPTVQRLRDAWWNPDDDRLFTPRAFGVGWALNLARLRRLVTT
jgi:hypothetical protein